MEEPTEDTEDTEYMENTEAEDVDTSEVYETAEPSWKEGLDPDVKNMTLLEKFKDTPEGLNDAFESHANLEHLLGHEKVPIPRDINDVEGWNRFSKAMGIPDKAQGYGLPDPKVPEHMQDLKLDKNMFSEVMHAYKVHPSAVKGLWEAYQELAVESYQRHIDRQQQREADNTARLKGEWGDSYDQNIELGQMVISKFSDGQDEFITNLLSDQKGKKFLARIGEQFADKNGFMPRPNSVTPAQAMDQIRKIKSDLNGPYMNQLGKHNKEAHDSAVAEVNRLLSIVSGGR